MTIFDAIHIALEEKEEDKPKWQRYMEAIYHWAHFQDRILFRKYLKLLAEHFEEESARWQFTEGEQKKWKAIVDTAMKVTKREDLPGQWREIVDFFDCDYRKCRKRSKRKAL
jgi:hypothetical protein